MKNLFVFRAKFIVKRSEEEKKITVIRAEAESESATIFNEAILNHGIAFLELKKMEAAKDIVENLSKAKNVVFISGNAQADTAGSNSNFLIKI